MKKLLWVLLLCSPLTAWAGGYAGLDYAFSDITPKNSASSANVDAIQFKFGTWLNSASSLAWEFRAALGTSSDSIHPAGLVRQDIEINRYFGTYIRGEFPLKLPVRPYGLLGLSRVETNQTNVTGTGRSTSTEAYNDISLGLGVDADITPNVFADIEYMRVADYDGKQVTNLTIGINGRF